MPQPELMGSNSLLFPNFPYPFDGKQVLFAIAQSFGRDFDKAAAEYLRADKSSRLLQPLAVRGAYPTTKAECPSLAVIRTASSPRSVGIGNEIESDKIKLPSGEIQFRRIVGNYCTDTVEVAICCLNELMRDDLTRWFQQYVLDAVMWNITALANNGCYKIQCTNAQDDIAEYQGSATQPGFQFHLGRLTFQVEYELIIAMDALELKTACNWQAWGSDLLWAGIAGDSSEYTSQPDKPND
ncbi:MAG: hypothetical protein LRZ84_14415 [Desertifilum sp.]|nr:hypothetical protein [Desertifilum sp.]